MSTMEEIIRAAETVRDMLTRSGLHRQAAAINAEIKRLQEAPIQAARTLASMCHVKGLGDIYLEEIPGYEWPDAVSSLRMLCLNFLGSQGISTRRL